MKYSFLFLYNIITYMAVSNVQEKLWEKLQDDINDLSKPLQKLLRQGFET